MSNPVIALQVSKDGVLAYMQYIVLRPATSLFVFTGFFTFSHKCKCICKSSNSFYLTVLSALNMFFAGFTNMQVAYL